MEMDYEMMPEGLEGGLEMEGLEMDPMNETPSGPLYNIQPPIQIPVTTPATVPQAFQPQQLFPKHFEPMLGQGSKGPDVFFRIQMGLQSGVRSETDWCLSTLVTFSGAPNIDMLRERTDILQDVINYIYENWDLVTASKTEMDDTYAVLERRQKVLEALLVVRNVCMDVAAAPRLAPWTFEFVQKGVNLSLETRSLYREMRLLILEICEHVCFCFTPQQAAPDSPLFTGLVNLVLLTEDKALLVSALRSLARLLIAEKEGRDVSVVNKILAKVLPYLLVDDVELAAALLDFLTQYTSRLQRVEQLLPAPSAKAVPSLPTLVTQLIRMLTFRMDREPQDYIRLPRRTRRPAPLIPPEIPPAIMSELLLLDEPERATMWIRSCYDTDPDGEVLQVSLWTNYQRLFEPHERDGTGKRLLKAIEFIRTCTTNVRGAQAKVVTVPEGTKKFIIKGLVPREKAVPLSELRNQGGMLEPEAPPRGPPVYGNTAALVLTNISKLQGGKDLLEPFIPDLVQAIIINPALAVAIDRLLTQLK